MSPEPSSPGPLEGDFTLGDWLVRPRLNRLSRAGHDVPLEPKMMDVLAFLAEHAGEVVSKRDIIDGVWPDVFITESVLTRAIAGLRKALEDDAKSPRYIETISKRGYRLMVAVRSLATAPVRGGLHMGSEPIHGESPAVPRVGFVVGQWVRGARFYGRNSHIAELLDGQRNCLWLLGTRRIGKTSVLKHLEHLASTRPGHGYIPIFWDLQGLDDPEELHLDFHDALLDAEDRLLELGIDVTGGGADDLFVSLGRLRRAALARNRTLLLLCDEAEELIQLRDKSPALLRKLRRALQSREGLRSVLASSSRLWVLAEHPEDTSPFLDGFTPPVYLGRLSDQEARDLAQQVHLPADVRPGLDDDGVEEIRRLCGNHPYLIQMLCKRVLELGDVDTAVAEVAADRSLAFLFAVDLGLLSVDEQALLRLLAGAPRQEPVIASDLQWEASRVRETLHQLTCLGLVRPETGGRFLVNGALMEQWLSESA